ncbi:cytochrome c oxidase subunit 4 [Mobilicoccus sp.]|uniref:aa3-type cytochrome oxidase subunit IV n=1 Tax=Mobilicoccus sp. TaxID=2034349 RepID=UPI0028AE5F43|nr:cytochrome c oxidase subunit 4 [Mobilicoccus sp.]
MKQTSALFNAAFIFFVPVTIIYGFFTKWQEPVGVVAMLLLGLMGLMFGMYLRLTMKKLDRDPADDPRGEQWMQEGEYGFFSPHSWWPLPLAASAIIVFLGLRLGLWVFLVGVVFGAVALIGWVFEYFRQDMAI